MRFVNKQKTAWLSKHALPRIKIHKTKLILLCFFSYKHINHLSFILSMISHYLENFYAFSHQVHYRSSSLLWQDFTSTPHRHQDFVTTQLQSHLIAWVLFLQRGHWKTSQVLHIITISNYYLPRLFMPFCHQNKCSATQAISFTSVLVRWNSMFFHLSAQMFFHLSMQELLQGVPYLFGVLTHYVRSIFISYSDH